MTSLTSFLRGCYLPSLLRPMLHSVEGFAISSDGYFLLFELPYQLLPFTLITQSRQLVLSSNCILSLRNCGLSVVGAPNYERAYLVKRFTNIARHPVCCVFEPLKFFLPFWNKLPHAACLLIS